MFRRIPSRPFSETRQNHSPLILPLSGQFPLVPQRYISNSRLKGAAFVNPSIPFALDPYENLYRYESSRFLYGEEEQLKERYKKFSVPALMEVSRKATSSRACVDISKHAESTFKKDFLCTMDDGKKVIARIPHDLDRAPRYTTASEVATMDFVRRKVNIPVPEVFDYSIESNNEVGSEYIIMEYVRGEPLGTYWDDLQITDKGRIVLQLVEQLSPLLALQFSKYGNLYFKSDIPSTESAPHLYNEPSADDSKYCIGPSSWFEFHDPERLAVGMSRGPCTSLSSWINIGTTPEEMWTSICEREIKWISKHAKPRDEDDPLRQLDSQECPQSHIEILQKCIELAPSLTPPFPSAVPTLWPSYLFPNDILVSYHVGEPPRIVSFHDWLKVDIGPLYLQHRVPRFITNADSAKKETHPDLPEDRPLERLYREYLHMLHPDKTESLQISYARLQKRLMNHCGFSWTVRNLLHDVRVDLIYLLKNWKEMGLMGSPPITLSDEILKTHEIEGKDWESNWEWIRTVMKNLGIDKNGEVTIEEYAAKKEELERLKNIWIQELKTLWEKHQGKVEEMEGDHLFEAAWPFRYPHFGF